LSTHTRPPENMALVRVFLLSMRVARGQPAHLLDIVALIVTPYPPFRLETAPPGFARPWLLSEDHGFEDLFIEKQYVCGQSSIQTSSIHRKGPQFYGAPAESQAEKCL